jgi:exodeoxyribonuclease-5
MNQDDYEDFAGPQLPDLTDEQESVIQRLVRFDKDVQTLGGYAGTGKTTLVGHLCRKELRGFAVCAFTGKAANVLRRKGIGASTIHSLIYEPETDESGRIILYNGVPNFVLKRSLDCDGVLVDESSMVSRELYKDLSSFGLPMIFVGDHGQLEPVGEGMNLMAQPDYVLETIHRNAGEIAHFAEHIRKGFRPASWNTGGKVHFLSRGEAQRAYSNMDQIICAYNKTRVEVNKTVRRAMGYENNWPVVGDRVMCLRNDKKSGLFNGMQGKVKQLYTKPKNKMVFETYDTDIETMFDPQQFNKEKGEFSQDRNDPAPFDFAYCITAHKSQGDEWEKVMVLEQKCRAWDHRRWAYTAASRAKTEVYWVEGF